MFHILMLFAKSSRYCDWSLSLRIAIMKLPWHILAEDFVWSGLPSSSKHISTDVSLLSWGSVCCYLPRVCVWWLWGMMLDLHYCFVGFCDRCFITSWLVKVFWDRIVLVTEGRKEILIQMMLLWRVNFCYVAQTLNDKFHHERRHPCFLWSRRWLT